MRKRNSSIACLIRKVLTSISLQMHSANFKVIGAKYVLFLIIPQVNLAYGRAHVYTNESDVCKNQTNKNQSRGVQQINKNRKSSAGERKKGAMRSSSGSLG